MKRASPPRLGTGLQQLARDQAAEAKLRGHRHMTDMETRSKLPLKDYATLAPSPAARWDNCPGKKHD